MVIQVHTHSETEMKTKTPTDNQPTDDAEPSLEGALAFSIDGFARASSLGRSYIYEAIKDGRLKSTKHGKRRIILRQDAEAFLRGEARP